MSSPPRAVALASIFTLLAALLAFLPLAAAQSAMPEASLSLAAPTQNQPSNRTLVVPVDVTFEAGGQFCPTPGTTPLSVAVTARGPTGALEVSPATLTFEIPTQTLTGYAATQTASVVVPPEAEESRVTVTASFAGGAGGCLGTGPLPAASDELAFTARFAPQAVDPDGEPGEEMPGLGLVALLAAVGVAFVAARR